VRFAQKLSNPLHFVCRVSITFPQFSSMPDGHGDAPCYQDLCDKEFGWKPCVVAAGGTLDFIPNLFRPVIVYPSFEMGAIIRTRSGRFFVFPQNSVE
jgi:hypothetical protein